MGPWHVSGASWERIPANFNHSLLFPPLSKAGAQKGMFLSPPGQELLLSPSLAYTPTF